MTFEFQHKIEKVINLDVVKCDTFIRKYYYFAS